jgi:hypothetical protein
MDRRMAGEVEEATAAALFLDAPPPARVRGYVFRLAQMAMGTRYPKPGGFLLY